MHRPNLNALKRVDLAPRQDSLHAYSKATARQRGSAPPGPSAKPPGTVPPPRNDVMTAPVYRPATESPRRPGADDHYKYRSLSAA
jgi:hypothetical protein